MKDWWSLLSCLPIPFYQPSIIHSSLAGQVCFRNCYSRWGWASRCLWPNTCQWPPSARWSLNLFVCTNAQAAGPSLFRSVTFGVTLASLGFNNCYLKQDGSWLNFRIFYYYCCFNKTKRLLNVDQGFMLSSLWCDGLTELRAELSTEGDTACP